MTCKTNATLHVHVYPNLALSATVMHVLMSTEDGREVGFEHAGCYSRLFKRERINNQTFKILLSLILTLTLNLT